MDYRTIIEANENALINRLAADLGVTFEIAERVFFAFGAEEVRTGLCFQAYWEDVCIYASKLL